MNILPEGFEDLEHLVAEWALANSQQRFLHRYECEFTALRSFYDAMLPRAEAALQALESQPLHALDETWQRLQKLLMSLAHVALAIERHNQPRASAVNWPTTLQIIQGSLPA